MDKTVATIEIKNSNFKLLIGYLFENKINVLYKKTYPLRISNKDGDIYDLNSLSEDLKQIKNISDPKKRLRVDINEVVLALPPFGLDVYEASKTTSTVDIDAKINKTDISNCLNMFKKLSYDTTNSSIVDIVPFAFSVDDNRTFFTPPLGETSKSLMINAHIYMMPTRIVDSFKKADVLISDTSSMLTYSFVSGKPTIYTQNIMSKEVNNWAAKWIYTGCFVINTVDSLKALLENLQEEYHNTIAPLQNHHEKILNESFYFPQDGSVQRIINILVADRQNTITRSQKGE